MPQLIEFYDRFAADRDKFEIIAFHDDSVKDFKELDPKLRPIIKNTWKGRPLPFPILLDATGQTLGTNYGIRGFPTVILIDPEGKVVRHAGESTLESILQEEKTPGRTVALSANGRRLALAGPQAKVDILDPTDASRRLASITQSNLTALALSPDGRRLATAGRDRSIRLWEAATGRPLATLRGHEHAVFALAFSPDGRTLASGGFDTVRLWEVDSAKAKDIPNPIRSPIWSVAFSPDGQTLAAGAMQHVLLLEVASGKAAGSIDPLRTVFRRAVAFSPDGRSLAVGQGDAVVVYDVATAQKRASFDEHDSAVVHVEFSADGATLASVSRGKSTRLRQVPSGAEPASPPAALLQRAELLRSHLPDDAAALSAESRAVVRKPGASTAAYAQALAQARTAVRLAPTDTNALETLGLALYRAGHYAEAIPVLTQAAQHLPEPPYFPKPLPDSLPALALACLKKGDHPAAWVAAARVRALLMSNRRPNPDLWREMETELIGPGAADARSRLEVLLGEQGRAAQALAALNADASLSAELRQTAQRLAPIMEAERLVAQLGDEIILKDRIKAAVSQHTNLTAEVRAYAGHVVDFVRESPSALNGAAWSTVSHDGQSTAAYELALAQAERAYQLRPERHSLNTLGVALYRNGRYEQALETLQRSANELGPGMEAPEDLAFMVMAQFKLGRVEEARQGLARLRQAVTQPEGDGEPARFLREAEALARAASASAR